MWAAEVNGPGFVGGLDGFGVTRRATPGRSALQTLADKRVSALGDCARFDASTAGRPLLLPRAGRAPAGAIFCQTAPACRIVIGGVVPPFRYQDRWLPILLVGYDIWRRRALWTAARTFIYSRPPGTTELRDAVIDFARSKSTGMAQRSSSGSRTAWITSPSDRWLDRLERIVAKRLAGLRDPAQDLASREWTADRLAKFNLTNLAPAAAKGPPANAR